MDKYYISYENRARNSENYPYDIEMGSFDNLEIAENYLLEYLNAKIRYENYQDILGLQPILITNDKALSYKYKYVFDYSEFKLFCNCYDKFDNLTFEEKALVSAGIPGEYGKLTFVYFKKLIANEGKNAYQYTVKESFYDEENGSLYSHEIKDGWKIRDSFFWNNEIKKRHDLS